MESPAEPDTARGDARAAPPMVPLVVAAVVAHDPGPWFEEALAAVAAQDHPRLRAVVIDAGSDPPIGPRVADILADAEVHRLIGNPGFGAAVNEIADIEPRAAFYLLLHDDVALAPDAVRLMVDEAIRSNAGLVGPKLVDWDDPTRLRQVGIGMDKTGAVVPYAEADELDQEQHDALRDAFGLPNAAMLIRADLFSALGGFDPTMSYHGEALDLCWRAHVAGARVMVVPSALGRHREALDTRRDNNDELRLAKRHQIRSLLSNYGIVHSLRVVPQAALVSVIELVWALATARLGRARAVAGAWTWNLARPQALWKRRRRLHRLRQLGDGEVRRLQNRGFAPVNAFLRGRAGRKAADVPSRTQELLDALRAGPSRVSAMFWIAVLIVLALGSRELLSEGVPVIGDFTAFPADSGDFFADWWSGWRAAGLGRDGPAPTLDLLLGSLSAVFFGAMGLFRTTVILAMIPLGLLGIWRLVRYFESPRVSVVALTAYAVVPVPYNAMANGTWTALGLYGAMPWIVGYIARSFRQAPYGPFDGEPSDRISLPSPVRETLGFGIVLAIAAAFAPITIPLTIAVLVVVLAASLLTGAVLGSIRLILITLAACGLAVALNLPWSLDLLTGGWSVLIGGRSPDAGTDGLAELLRFDTGPVGGEPLGWALVLSAVLPLILSRGPRFAWSVRGWMLYLVSVGGAWAAQQGFVPIGFPRPEILLVPGAVGLSLAIAMGMAAFEIDLRRYRFGWRQIVPVTAGVALALAVVPIVVAAFDGRWDMPRRDFGDQLPAAFAGVVDDEDADADPGIYRVLWIGSPDLVPARGWELDDGLIYATSVGGMPTVLDRFPGPEEPETEQLARALDIALSRRTSRLGALLGPMGVRFIVLPEGLAQRPFAATTAPAPEALVGVLAEQLDLRRVELGAGGVIVYENAQWVPVRAALPAGVMSSGPEDFTDAVGLDTSAAVAALDGDLRSASGTLAAGDELYLSTNASPHWELTGADGRALRGEAFGWANVFSRETGGRLTLAYETPASHRLGIVAQLGLWIVAIAVLVRIIVVERRVR